MDEPGEPQDAPKHGIIDGPAEVRSLPEIRAAAAEVFRRVEEWHDSPNWLDNEQNRSRYELTMSISRVQGNPTNAETVIGLESVVRLWHPAYVGSEQAIYAAIERLRLLLQEARHELGLS